MSRNNKSNFDVDEFIIFFCWPVGLALVMLCLIIFIECDKRKNAQHTTHPIEVEAK